ncbi:MAG: PilX N-terminal domain-containing pilus assembly protein [Nitrospirota bacterium]
MKKLFINLKRDEKGAALIIVLLILIIIAALGTAAIMTSSIGTKISSNQYNAAQVLQGADTGVQMALAELNFGNNSSVTPPHHDSATFDSKGNRIGTCKKEHEDDQNDEDGSNDSAYKAGGTWNPKPIVGQIQVPNGLINYTAVFSAKTQNAVTKPNESQEKIDEEDHDHYVDKENRQTADDSNEGDAIHKNKDDGYGDSDHEGGSSQPTQQGPVVYQVTCTAYLHSGNTVTRAKIIADTSKDNLTVNAPAAVYALGNISTAGNGSLNGTGGSDGIDHGSYDTDTHTYTGGNGDREDVDDDTGAIVTRTYDEDCDGKVLSAHKDDEGLEHGEIDESGGIPAYEAHGNTADVIKWTGTAGFANATSLLITSDPTAQQWLGVSLSDIAKSADDSYTQTNFQYNVPGDSEASPKTVYVEGNLTLSQSGGGFGLLVVHGDLTVTSPAYTWRGLVYVTGNVTIAGSGKLHVHGALMSGGNVVSPSGTDLTVSYFSNELLNINTAMKAKILNWHRISM